MNLSELNQKKAAVNAANADVVRCSEVVKLAKSEHKKAIRLHSEALRQLADFVVSGQE